MGSSHASTGRPQRSSEQRDNEPFEGSRDYRVRTRDSQLSKDENHPGNYPLGHSGSEFQGLRETSIQGVITVDDHCKLLFANQAAARIFGYDNVDELCSLPNFEALVVPHERARLEAYNTIQLNGGKVPEAYVFEGLRKDDSMLWLRNFSTVVNWKGEPALQNEFIDITELKRTESSLKESEESKRLLTDALPISIAYVDTHLCYRFVNKTFRQWHRLDSTEILGKSIKTVLGSNAFDDIYPHITEVLSGKGVEFEARLPYKRAGSRYVQCIYVPHFDEHEEIRGFYGLVTDISQRKNASETLKRQELINEKMFDAIIATDDDCRIIEWNPGAEEMFGYNKNEVLGKTCRFLHKPEDADRIEADFARAIESNENWSGEIYFVHKDGSVGVRDTVMVPIPDRDRSVAGFTVSRDVTQRKKADLTLEKSEYRYRRLVELIPDAIIIQKDGKIVFSNIAGAKVLGAESPFYLIGRKLIDFAVPEYKTEIDTRNRRALEQNRSQPFMEQQLVQMGGTVITVEASVIPYDYEGEPAILSVIRDITRDKQAQELIREPKGRRQRLKKQVKRGGANSLSDQELLELVLYAAYPRANVESLSVRLLDQFGTFADVISATPERLDEVMGVGDSTIVALKAVQAAAVRLTRERIIGRPLLDSWELVLDYLRSDMAREAREKFRVLFLDRKNILITDEVLQVGTVDQATVSPREIVQRALNVGAAALILVHNHPSGDPSPSLDDVEVTKRIIKAAAPVGIEVHDHIIVGRDGHTSLKSMCLI